MQPPHIENLEQMDSIKVLDWMNHTQDGPNSRPFETARSAIQVKSIFTLSTSIDEFRKSNERGSNVLIGLTIVLAFAALVQAATLVYQIVK